MRKGPKSIQRRCAGTDCLTLVSGAKYCLVCAEKKHKAWRQQYGAERKHNVSEREAIQGDGPPKRAA